MTRPLRVFHLIKSLGRGGAEVLLAEGLRVADRERFTYGYGYFTPWKDAVVPSLEAQGAGVVRFDARSNPAILLQAGRVAAFLRRWRADLLHCHLPVAAVAGRVAGKLTGVPVVTTEHNEVEHFHPPHPLARPSDVAVAGAGYCHLRARSRLAKAPRCPRSAGHGRSQRRRRRPL